jgi:hypothetical protein
MKAKIKKETMWAIYGPYGLYCGTHLLRRTAIAEHVRMKGKSWKQCRRDGDVAVKVVIMPANCLSVPG